MNKDDNYYKSLDKRTTEYKEWAKFNKIANKPEGLGDTVENVLNSKPLKPITKAIKNLLWKDGEDCGCDERKKKLNKLVKYNRKPQRCLTQTQYNRYKDYVNHRTLNVWQPKEIELLIELYAHVFAIKYHNKDLCRNCSGSGRTLLRMSKELDKVFETYEG